MNLPEYEGQARRGSMRREKIVEKLGIIDNYRKERKMEKGEAEGEEERGLLRVYIASHLKPLHYLIKEVWKISTDSFFTKKIIIKYNSFCTCLARDSDCTVAVPSRPHKHWISFIDFNNENETFLPRGMGNNFTNGLFDYFKKKYFIK